MSTVLAFDLSTTAAGVCWEGATSTIKPAASLSLQERCELISFEAERIAGREEPELIIIEAHATRFVQVAFGMGVIHGLTLRGVSGHAVLPVMRVDPKRLKKFATGNGNADKVQMVLKAKAEGWQDPDDADDNQADAWWLWALGKAWLGHWVVPQTAYRTEILMKIREEIRA